MMNVCMLQRFSLTAEPIWTFFTVKLRLGPDKVYNYLGGGYLHPQTESGVVFTLLLSYQITQIKHFQDNF